MSEASSLARGWKSSDEERHFRYVSRAVGRIVVKVAIHLRVRYAITENCR